jgi:hypothetical protein
MKALPRATRIGLIAGTLMILFSLAIYYYHGNFETGLQYLTYLLYMAAVIYGQYLFFKNASTPLHFKNFFAEGFRIFIIITLLMVVFTIIFLKMNPNIRADMAEQYRADLIKSGNRTPEQIISEVEGSKSKFITFFTSLAIFGYLMIGGLASLIGALFFTAKSSTRQSTL